MGLPWTVQAPSTVRLALPASLTWAVRAGAVLEVLEGPSAALAAWSRGGLRTLAAAGSGAQPTTRAGAWAPWPPRTEVIASLGAVRHGARQPPMHTGAAERHGGEGPGRTDRTDPGRGGGQGSPPRRVKRQSHGRSGWAGAGQPVPPPPWAPNVPHSHHPLTSSCSPYEGSGLSPTHLQAQGADRPLPEWGAEPQGQRQPFPAPVAAPR